MLTTGVNVPAITNLVFMRRTNSRILYEQMLGRATRKCYDIGKECFYIYDAVGIYDALKVIAHNFHEDKDVSFYAGMCNLSISHFTHRFKAVTGKSLKEYVAYIRVEKAKELLYNTNLSVKEIAESVGYSDQNYFSRIFKKYSGESPLGYRKKYN